MCSQLVLLSSFLFIYLFGCGVSGSSGALQFCFLLVHVIVSAGVLQTLLIMEY